MLLFVDYDGVLNDMPYSWVDWINHEYNLSYTPSDITHWEWFNDLDIDAFKWFHNGVAFNNWIKPLPESQEFFTHVKDYYDTTILTASSVMMKKHKDRHIEKHYGDVEVIHHTDKWDYAVHPSKICVLIDDRPLNCVKWVEAGGIAFLFNHKGNYKQTEIDYEHENLLKVQDYDTIKIHLSKIVAK